MEEVKQGYQSLSPFKWDYKTHWARGPVVSTAGFELEQVREYILAQEEADGSKGQF